MKRKWFM